MPTWLVVGLGNPGPTYARHRHNIGAMVVAELARRGAATTSRPRGMRAEVATVRIGSAGTGVITADAQPVHLVRTTTYMNESGIPVGKLAAFHRIPAENIIVVHDELDLDPGRLRLKIGGGDNGHNGLKSIRAHLGTGEFLRVRMGIGRPPGRQPTTNWVLSDFPSSEREELGVDVARAADAVETLVVSGLVAAQNTFNS